MCPIECMGWEPFDADIRRQIFQYTRIGLMQERRR
jgi:hypothetical protein